MKADKSLLNASNEMSTTTGFNYNEVFNKQYEGLVEFNKQIGELQLTDNGPNRVSDANEDLKLSAKALEKLSTEMTFSGIKTFKDHYEENGSLNQGVIDVAFNDLNLKGTELEALQIRKTTNQKDKKRQSQLRQEVAQWRKNLVEIKPLITSTVKGLVEGHYNEELSFANDLEIGPVLKQWLDPKSDYQELGIGTYFSNTGEMYITYTPGKVFKSEYENNKKRLNYDPRIEAEVDAMKRQIEDEQGMTVGFEDQMASRSIYGASAGDDPIQGGMLPEVNIEGTKVISVKDALNGFVKKDIKTGNKINDVFGQIIETSQNTMPSQDKKTQIYQYENLEDLEAIAHDSYMDLFLTADPETGEFANIHDLSTRDQLIGGQMRNYKQDLLDEKSFFHKLRYEDVGLKNSLDADKDGFVSNNELDEKSKEDLTEILTNPKTSSQRKIASEQWAWYLTQITKQAAESQRKRQLGANTVSGLSSSVEAATAGLSESMQESAEEGTSELAQQLIEKYSK
tara:strand:- start:1992 stop:3524 length:1533 start_codon:yes stop_codon:yes gene_type:complete